MISRSTLFTHPGGDTVQIQKTAEYLNKVEGVLVTIKTVNQSIDYGKYDLLHLFNISRPADLLGVIKKAKLPYVLSTIYVDFSEAEKNHHSKIRLLFNKIFKPDQVEYLKTIARIIKGQDTLTEKSYLFKGQKKAIIEIIKKAKILLPNSESEYNRLERAYGCKKEYKVIPNAIDVDIFKNTSPDKSYDKFENAIISVGQITPVKNQLNLIKALKGSKYKLFIIGSPSSNAKGYFQKCKELASTNIEFIPFVEQEQLANIYNKAKVHVLASWFETTGLVSLEASYMGCNIVITDRGDQKEYFNEDAYYCDPTSPKSILKAVEKAYNNEYNSKVRTKILNKYTWQNTAKKTYSAYNEVLSN